MAQGKKPNCLVLWPMQKYSTRAWVYREGQGWIFAELMPDELTEFKSYECRRGKGNVTIPRMKVRIPYSRPIGIAQPTLKKLDSYANWFACCTLPQAHPLVLRRFRLYQKTDDEPTRYPVELGGYETGLWADEVKFCRGLGCEVTIHFAYAWDEWGVPAEWKPPLPPFPYKARVIKEYVFIYAFVNELTQEVYVGQTDNVERRRAQHLRDTNNSDKVALLQSLRAQGRELEPIILEEVAGEKAYKREQYWTSYYKSQGYKIINRDFWWI